MSIFSTIFKPVSDIVGNVLDKTITDKNEAQRLKHEINMAIMNEGEQALKGATEIIVAESNGSFYNVIGDLLPC